MRVALELVSTPVDTLGSDIPQDIVRHTRDGVSERCSYCLGMARQAKTKWQNEVCANVDCLLFRLLGNVKLGPMAIVGSGWGHGPHC